MPSSWWCKHFCRNCCKPVITPVTGGPEIVVANLSTVPLGDYALPTLQTALQAWVNNFFAPVWGTPCKLVSGTAPVAGKWAFLFLDDADQAGALGYHDITSDGLPLGKIFVKTTQRYGEEVSVTASHELGEMLVDPGINLCASRVVTAEDNYIYAYESCDAVEEQSFLVGGIPMSNFVTPQYFEDFHRPGTVKYDYLGNLSHAFEIAPGGYMPVFDGNGWTQIFGSAHSARPSWRAALRPYGPRRHSGHPR